MFAPISSFFSTSLYNHFFILGMNKEKSLFFRVIHIIQTPTTTTIFSIEKEEVEKAINVVELFQLL